MPWTIVSINNLTHELQVKRDSGESLSLIIPEEHRISSQIKNNWIKLQIDTEEKKIKKITQKAPQSNFSKYLYSCIIIEFLIISLMYLFHK